MTTSKLINEKKSEEGYKHVSVQKFDIGQTVQIFTDGIDHIVLGKIKSVMTKNSKFVGSYLLYEVEYVLQDVNLTDIFYSNELFPEDEEITRKKRKKKYLNNRDLFKALIKWQAENKIVQVRLPEYIGECFVKLVNNIAKQGYHSHIDDMKAEALMICCRYAHVFDPDKSINAFSYFTKAIKNSMAQIHNKEKAQIDGKFQFIKNEYCNNPSYDYRVYNEGEESDE